MQPPNNLGSEVNPTTLQIGKTYYVYSKEKKSLRKWIMESTFKSSSGNYFYVSGRQFPDSIHSNEYEVSNPEGRALSHIFFEYR